ncbi:hypothetical protein AB1L07_02100 [Niallia alba]|uniref:hypothetical protein n=1 Tax=Niallia alba TaxID=2729105 RepID=UPI0039A0E0C5
MFSETRNIKWEYEDQINIDITDSMFKLSEVIDGVRMYPYIEIGFGKYFLE